MSTSKHIDKICIAVIVINLILTLLFINGEKLGLTITGKIAGYEKRLFDTGSVHSIDIVMNDWDSFIEECENEEYSSCTVLIDGEKYSDIGIRAKGNTSLSTVSSMGSKRYSFKLEFDHFEDGKNYYGLDKLCLNNLIQDNTMMKDYLVYQMMDEFGVDSPLCSYTYITVNGEDWGLYLAVEGVEDSFLTRNYGSDYGELYKPDSMDFGGGRGNGKEFDMDGFDGFNEEVPQMPDGNFNDFNGKDMPQMPCDDFSNFNGKDMPQMPDGDFSDFNGKDMPQMPDDDFNGFNGKDMPQMPDDGQNNDVPGKGFGGFGGMGSDDIKLKYIDDDPDSYSNIFDSAKTDISASDKNRLISALKNLSSYSDLENTLDTEEVLRYFVVHNFVVNEDSYTGSMIHNYYLHEKDGQLEMIPWDYNLAFGTFSGGDASSSVNASIDEPVSGGNSDDRPMVGWIFSNEEYTGRYHELFSEFTDEWITSGKLSQLIDDTKELISPYVEKDPTKFCTAEEFDSGISTLSEFISLRGVAVKRQLSGDTVPVDTNGLDISAMGSMGKNAKGMSDRKGKDSDIL